MISPCHICLEPANGHDQSPCTRNEFAGQAHMLRLQILLEHFLGSSITKGKEKTPTSPQVLNSKAYKHGKQKEKTDRTHEPECSHVLELL